MRSNSSARSGYFASVGFELRKPSLVQALAALAHAAAEVLAHAVRNEKLGVLRPAVAPLGETDLLHAERLAMGGAGVMLVRRAVADVAVDDDQCRRIVSLAENLDRLGQSLVIVGVADVLHVPAIGKETRRDIVAESQIRVPFDRHAVAVVESNKDFRASGDQRAKPLRSMTPSIMSPSPHIDVDVVVEHREIRAVEMLGQPAPGQSPCRRSLPQPWPRGPVVVSTPEVR